MSEELTENTPLISNEGGVSQIRVVEEQKRQLRVIYLIHFLSTTSASIFTLETLSFLIHEKDRNDADFRVYNSFIIAQILLSVIWGYYSDKIGRKRILNICLLSSALAIFLFGFCNSIGSGIFASFLVGSFSCVYNVVKTIFGESTNKSNRPLSFIFLIIITAIAYNIGITISVSLSSPIFTPPGSPNLPPNQAKLPFLIPCLIASGINIIAFILSHLYLSETLGNRINLENDNATISTDYSDTLAEFELYTMFGLNIPKDNILIVTGFPLIAIIFTGFRIIFIHWPQNQVSKGGLNLIPSEYIGAYFTILPIVVLLTLTLYSSIHKRLGSLKLYKMCFLPIVVVFILSSTITLVARTGNVPAVLTLLMLVVSSIEIFYYLQEASLNLLLIESSESTGNLGTLFGISGALENIFNLTVPGLINLIYKFSTERGLPFPLNYNLVWIILTITALIGHWSSSKIKNL